MKKIISILLILTILPLASAFKVIEETTVTSSIPNIKGSDIVIETSSYSPSPAEPGKYVDVWITVQNYGDKEIKNSFLKVDASYPFYLTSRDNGVEELKTLHAGGLKTVKYTLLIDDQALGGDYNLGIKFCHDEFCENEIKRVRMSISVNTGGKPTLEIGIDDYDLFTPGKLGEIIITAVNKGKIGIQFLTIELIDTEDYDIISVPRKYLGELASDDFERETYQIYINPDIKTSGEIPIKIKIEYSDSNFKNYESLEEVIFNVYTERDAKRIGLMDKSSSFLYIILALGAGFLGYRMIRRRKRRNVR